MSTTPEGKMTALLDDIDRKVQVLPQSEVFRRQSSGSSIHVLVAESNGDLEPRVASYEATVTPSGSEMTGV